MTTRWITAPSELILSIWASMVDLESLSRCRTGFSKARFEISAVGRSRAWLARPADRPSASPHATDLRDVGRPFFALGAKDAAVQAPTSVVDWEGHSQSVS